jgi:hypothetical protein
MRCSPLTSYHTLFQLAYRTINGICCMLSRRHQWAWNRLSVMNWWCTGKLRPRTHFDINAIEKIIIQPLSGTPENPCDLSCVL